MSARALRALCIAASLALAPLVGRAAPQIVAPGGAPILVDASKGIILRLDRPAANVFVADPAIADVSLKSPTTLYLVGKAAGVTTIFAVDQDDQVLLNSRVEVRHDAQALQHALNEMIPGNHVEVRPVDDSLVLEGPVASAAQGNDIDKIAARFVPDKNHIINNTQLDAPNQVNLRVRFAEVTRDVIKQLGVNWNALENVNGAAAAGASFPLSLTTAIPSTFSATSNTLSLGYLSGPLKTTNIDGVINALEQHDLLTVLAEPNLTAVSGHKASFLAGGEFPIPVPQASAGSAPVITIEYKDFGVSLSFTPTILANDRIALNIQPEVSQLSTQNSIQIDGFNIPSLTTRRAETTVEMGSGQSFVIGGLLQNNTTQDLTKFPWLADVPVLGALFRSSSFQRNESELVIIVTPYLVQPDRERLTTPADAYLAPTDYDRVMRGALNHIESELPTAAAPAPRAASAQPLAAAQGPSPAAAAPGAAPAVRPPVGPVGFEID